MGGRLTTATSSSSTATVHRTSTSASTNNLSHPRTHSTNGNQSVPNPTGTNHHRHRSSSTHHHHRHRHQHHSSNGSMHSAHHARTRAASTNVETLTTNPFNLNLLRYAGFNNDTDDQSSEEESPRLNRRRFRPIFFNIRDFNCPVCNKTIPSDSFDKHISHCLSKPRIDYNEDTLTEDKGECSICLDDLATGQKIARLPCLCIYHKSCIDNWFRINRTCPEHPGD